jgi:YtkA-like
MMTPITSVTTGTSSHTRRQGYVARGVILGSGLLVLALLAWAHLGLGALLFPPAPTPARQVANAGMLQVMMLADSGEMLVGAHNTISLAVNDATGKAITDAKVTVAADMIEMPMPVPPVDAVWADGRYTAHPVFSMAGPWQLTVSISAPGQPPVHATFRVGVRWHA